MEQYVIKKFAESLESLPRALAENAGVKVMQRELRGQLSLGIVLITWVWFMQATELISKLYAAHQEGCKNVGFDIEGEGVVVKDVKEAGVLDLFLAKWWGIRLATGAATTVLRVDQVGGVTLH